MLIWTTISFSGTSALVLIAFSKAGRGQDCLTKKSCGAASSVSTRSTRFCNADELRSTERIQRRSSDAFVARGVSLFSLPRFREHRRAGCADHDDVQSHGRKAQMALEGPLRQDYGLLPHAAGT